MPPRHDMARADRGLAPHPGKSRLNFFQWVAGGGLRVIDLRTEDLRAIQALLEKYRDRPMDLADASLVILAERRGLDQVLTLDRRDFDVYRLSGGRKFEQVLGRSGAM